MLIGIDHVQLAAPENSEEAARAFFADTLGMEEIEKPENLKKRGGVWFQCGTQQLHIGIQPGFAPATKAHPAFAIKDIQQWKEKLTNDGVVIKEDEPLEGAARFYVDDPFGNRLEFLERL